MSEKQLKLHKERNKKTIEKENFMRREGYNLESIYECEFKKKFQKNIETYRRKNLPAF